MFLYTQRFGRKLETHEEDVSIDFHDDGLGKKNNKKQGTEREAIKVN